MTSPVEAKHREGDLRRKAIHAGLKLRKSQQRDPSAADFGTYWLIDCSTNALVAGDKFGLDLDGIAGWLVDD